MTTAEQISGELMESIESNHAEPTLEESLQAQMDYLKAVEEADSRLRLPGNEDEQFVNWVMRTRREIEAEIKAVKKARDRQVRGLQNRLSGLWYLKRAEFQAAVERLAARDAKKGYTSDHGWAGWKMAKASVKVESHRDAWSAAVKAHLWGALSHSIGATTPILEHMENTGELLDGCRHVPEGNRFQPSMYVDDESYKTLEYLASFKGDQE